MRSRSRNCSASAAKLRDQFRRHSLARIIEQQSSSLHGTMRKALRVRGEQFACALREHRGRSGTQLRPGSAFRSGPQLLVHDR